MRKNQILFSFATKYIVHHSHAYGKDDYSIYDSVVARILNRYIKKYLNQNVSITYLTDTLKQKTKNGGNGYKEYHDYITRILKEINGSESITEVRRKVDLILWDFYRKRKELKIP